MEKRRIMIGGAVLLVSSVVAGGFFAAWKSGLFSARKVTYVAPFSEAGQQGENSPREGEKTESEESAPEGVKAVQEPQDAPSEIPAQKKPPEAGKKAENAAVSKNEKTKETEEKTAQSVSSGKIADKLVSAGFQNSSGREIDTVIVHSSYDALGNDPYSIDGIIAEYGQYGVSAHYLIGRDGKAYRLVEDEDVAWHAGASRMPDGRANVNDFSIGIEMVNTKDGKYTDAQYSALNSLLASLEKKYPIKYVFGHNDIAPGRKTDPWGMDWDKVRR